MALLLVALISISFSKACSPNLFKSIYKFSISLLFKVFLYIIHSSAKSLTVYSTFLQISFKQERNKSGPSTFPCGTPVSNLSPSDNCPPTRTLCVRARRDSPIHTTALESTPEAAIFVSNRSFVKSVIIIIMLSPLFSESQCPGKPRLLHSGMSILA
jgi:hypothetical protein